MFKNICLVGLPYSGKSSLGRKLALAKNIGFIETDSMIQNKYNCQLKDLIKKNGVTDFLNKENNIAKTIHCENNIISTGGSMVYSKEAINHFRDNLNCKIIHLHLTLNEFRNRVGDLDERGVINKYELSINELYLERIRLCDSYSDITINSDNKKDALQRLLKE
jgi:shikimate kinase|tara:strand:- start:126 stop:617 length:492 start_codon:yes stop_codon:yes gene_type:complete